jgi:hypothetical protein
MHQRKSQNMKKNKTLPILKNGSLRFPSGELKSCVVKNFDKLYCVTAAVLGINNAKFIYIKLRHNMSKFI